jgi:hypothetical protein
MAEAMAATGLAIIARKRNNACTRRIAEFVLPKFLKSKFLNFEGRRTIRKAPATAAPAS